MVSQRILNSQNYLEKEKQVGGLMFPNFKTYYKATISEHGIGTKTDIQTSGTEESSEIKLYIYGQMILTREPITSNGERTVSSTNGAGKTGYHMQMKLGPYTTQKH